jgi:hypothetical protein
MSWDSRRHVESYITNMAARVLGKYSSSSTEFVDWTLCMHGVSAIKILKIYLWVRCCREGGKVWSTECLYVRNSCEKFYVKHNLVSGRRKLLQESDL